MEKIQSTSKKLFIVALVAILTVLLVWGLMTFGNSQSFEGRLQVKPQVIDLSDTVSPIKPIKRIEKQKPYALPDYKILK